MLGSIRRWLGGAGNADGASVLRWARGRGFATRRPPEDRAVVVDGSLGRIPWRLEWGPPQRSFMPGPELRLVSELGLHSDLQVLVLNHELMERLEKSMFDEFVQGVQTRIDTETPTESRWLVMLPKLPQADLRDLRGRYGALASMAPWLRQWLAGPMGATLDVLGRAVDAHTPMVWTIARGRLMARVAMAHPGDESLSQWLAAFETAMRESSRLGVEWHDGGHNAPSTMPAAFARSGRGDGDLPPR
jgi:hypothetical protein